MGLMHSMQKSKRKIGMSGVGETGSLIFADYCLDAISLRLLLFPRIFHRSSCCIIVESYQQRSTTPTLTISG